MPPYNIESFDRNYKNTGHTKTSYVQWNADYISPKENIIETDLGFSAKKNDYIVADNGLEHFAGIIAEIEIEPHIKKIAVKDFTELLNVTVFYDRSFLSTLSCEQFIANLINACYINVDEFQRIAGMQVNVISRTMNAKLNLKDNIHNIHDVCIKALDLYGIVVSFEFNPQAQTLTATIGTVPENAKTIEANHKNILKETAIINQKNESLNKLTIINKKNEAQSVTYYIDQNDQVTTNPSGRVTPVIFMTKYIETELEDFATQAEEESLNTLKRESAENLIELTVLKDDQLIEPYRLKIGQTMNVIISAAAYQTRLTGMEYNINGTLKLIMGSIRIRLTERINMEV